MIVCSSWVAHLAAFAASRIRIPPAYPRTESRPSNPWEQKEFFKIKKILHLAEIETPVLTGGMKPRDFQDGDANDTKDDIM